MNEASARRIAVRVVSAAAGLGGFVLGYDAGDRISGTLLGIVMGANAAAIGALLSGAVAERLFAARGEEARERDEGRAR